MSIASEWAVKSETEPVTAANFDGADWSLSAHAWIFPDGSKGAFTKKHPLIREVGGCATFWAYRFEVID